MSISVVLATYNGEKYIIDQIESICSQLSEGDELIITDDGSSDETTNIINKLCKKYSIIKLFEGPKKGISANFENGILNAKNEFIFLSDQDDIWVSNKVSEVINCFQTNPNISVILHDAYGMKDEIINYETTLLTNRQYKIGLLNNLLKSSYYGCCMAFRQSFVKRIIPFPNNLIAHDQFIGLIGEINKVSKYINKPLIIHRFHYLNISKQQKFISKIIFRVRLLNNVVSHYRGE